MCAGPRLSQPRASRSAVREHKVELLSRSAVLELRLTRRAELTMIAVVDQPSGDVELGSTMVSPLIPAAVAVDLVAADLEKMRGVVVRQETQFLESFAQGLGLPYEAKNRYKVSALPEGRAVAASPTDAARWRPTNKDLLALPAALVAHEESKCGWRAALACCGCLNFRALTMHFFESVDGSDEGAGIERFRLTRPFRMGIKATIGLCAGVGLFLGRVVTYALPFFVAVPKGGVAELVFGVLGACVGLVLVRTRPESLRLRLSLVEEGGRVVGEVVEAFEPAAGTSSFDEKWWTCCCLCTFFARVTSETEPGFTLRFNSCCCGEHNNCCGATCCRPDLVIDVLDESGAVVSHVQKTFAPAGGDESCCNTLCRCLNQFDSFLVEFPAGASQRQRALLVAGLFSVEYEHFERKGGS